MKKRMFITTIVMMLVLAVALTTSSLAWFSSANVTVTANAATFKAATAGSSNVNLKISDTLGGWGNQISLTDGGRTMSGLVPTAPLISATAVGEDITTTGVTVNGSHVDVVHKGYVWPARMTFNSAKIGSESNFVIDNGANAVETYGSTARNSSENYYFDYFYIQNADSQNTLGSLKFQVTSELSVISEGSDAQAGDYTARGYVAFILFDYVNVAVGETVPSNAFENAGLAVVAYDTADVNAATQVKESGADEGLNVWVPFAAFTFATKKATTDTFQETAWQFADLDAVAQNSDDTAAYYSATKTGYYYNGENINSLNTQQYEALTGNGEDDGFILNTTTLRALNNKIVNASGNVAVGGKDENPAAANVRSEDVDTTSTFVMQPGEIFMVSMYYWLDGISLTEYTDTTISEIGLTIAAARN